MVDENTEGGEPDLLEPEDRTYGNRVQNRINSLVYERNTERDRASSLEAQLAASDAKLAAQQAQSAAVAANSNGNVASEKPELSDEDLSQWQGNFLGTVIEAAKVSLDGREGAEDLLKQLNSLRPEHYTYVSSQRMQKAASSAASEPVEALKSELTERGKEAAFKQALQNELRSDFGDDVLDMNSDLMKRASQLFPQLAPRYNNDDGNGAITREAVRAAHNEMRDDNRDGRALDESTHRRLAVAGEARREVSRDSATAALAARAEQGDWRAGLQLGQNKVSKWLEARAKGFGSPPPNFG